MRGADRFFGMIVEIVAKGRADLTLEFECRDQAAFIDNEKVPQLRGPKVARQMSAHGAADGCRRGPAHSPARCR